MPHKFTGLTERRQQFLKDVRDFAKKHSMTEEHILEVLTRQLKGLAPKKESKK